MYMHVPVVYVAPASNVYASMDNDVFVDVLCGLNYFAF